MSVGGHINGDGVTRRHDSLAERPIPTNPRAAFGDDIGEEDDVHARSGMSGTVKRGHDAIDPAWRFGVRSSGGIERVRRRGTDTLGILGRDPMPHVRP